MWCDQRKIAEVEGGELAISHLTRIEFSSLLAREARMGALDGQAARSADAQFETMVRESFVILLPNADDVVSGPDRQLIHQARPFSSSKPFSAFSAVRTPRRDRPSSVSVIATAGRMPTRTVSASSST